LAQQAAATYSCLSNHDSMAPHSPFTTLATWHSSNVLPSFLSFVSCVLACSGPLGRFQTFGAHQQSHLKQAAQMHAAAAHATPCTVHAMHSAARNRTQSNLQHPTAPLVSTKYILLRCQQLLLQAFSFEVPDDAPCL
jgi:hypothetical protein